VKKVNHTPLIEAGRTTRFGPLWGGRRCGAKTRKGTSCLKAALKDRSRCRNHGGLSRGPTTAQGRERVRAANWRHGHDEVDIIAMDGDELVIVEVKTRSSNRYGEPEEDVGPAKEKFLIRATEAYLEEKDLDVDSRFDIISVILNKNGVRINHIEDAFYPE